MKEIILTNGHCAYVDDEDELIALEFLWHTTVRGQTAYAEGMHTDRDGRRVMVKLHRVVMRVWDPTVFIDHIDGDGLNCLRSNLRIVTKQQNAINRVVTGRARFKGLSWEHKNENWVVRITCSGGEGRLRLGSFKDQVEAAQMYNWAARRLHGKYARLNRVPDRPDQDKYFRSWLRNNWQNNGGKQSWNGATVARMLGIEKETT